MKLQFVLCLFTFTSGLALAAENTSLKCTFGKAGREAGEVANISIEEVGTVSRSQVESGVPDVFMSDIVDDAYFIRKFVVNGTYTVIYNGKKTSETIKNRFYYGNFSKPIISEALTRSNIYTDYDKYVVKAFTVEKNYKDNGYDFQMYYDGDSYATNFDLDCKGTLPTGESVRKKLPIKKPYHRKLTCSLEKSNEFKALDFSFTVLNLHNSRLLTYKEAATDRSTGETSFLIGKGIKSHEINIFNSGDSGIYQSRDGKELVLSGDEDGVVEAKMGLKFPSSEDKKTNGLFTYKNPDGKWSKKHKVSCSITVVK